MTTKFKGTPMKLGDLDVVLPAMSLGLIEDYQDKIDEMLAGRLKKPATLMIDVFHKTLQRNHPELTREQVRNAVDLDNLQELFTDLLKRSGWEAGSGTAVPEGAPEGEPAAGTGQASTPTLSPAADSTPIGGVST